MRIGLVARMDKSGLANQTKNMAIMLHPDKILVIDSTSFNHNQQFPETYDGFDAYKVNGFPTAFQIRQWIRGLDVVLGCETFYNPSLIHIARGRNVKTVLQYNYEFLDNLINPDYPVPDVFLAPSYWMLEDMQARFKNVQYLPPPSDSRIFADAREYNFKNHGKRFLHIVGKRAAEDRNGTDDLLKALEHTSSEFTLTIKAQHDLGYPMGIDRRVNFDYTNPYNEADLYKGYDALIMPRRYAGLCLPMNEALMSGLPVIMTDISPNNRVLPKKWLVPSHRTGHIMTRTRIDLFSADPVMLAKTIDYLCETDISKEKIEAFDLGYNNYSQEALKERYLSVLQR